MAIKLFEHNLQAYNSVLEMLKDEGKAAVVHPTGTGKSFIGFKLCEDFPDKTICWLSPSEYIFKTQLENLAEAAEGWQPANIRFFTYAKLMLMSEEELVEIKPDYIVLDEFHRCGAEMWGAGVDNLIALYPDVPLLGLSATAIRYLDNQRNMVEELFDGNIASKMTLGEAIVRGILNPPKYVLSVFAYQEDYKKLESRVKRTKSKATRDKAEKYLEALRRALEMADGMDVIFDKHITDRTGKYIVFCSNIDHLREMQSNVANWFNRIDKEPHIYTAYSLDSTTEKEFEEFKQDESDHLKLLFCIDMLNEGVHVENVSGVILFRPTVSPIIYKQQIGRALSASKSTKDNPIIFDIVNNIENLYSIGTIEQEMKVAISYYRSLGEDSYIVNDRFEVIDEVRDAKALFDTLNDTLSASWIDMLEYATIYFNENGHLNVPRRYKTPDGYSLGNWIFAQRKVYAGEQYGTLTDEQIEKLNQIGMIWGSTRDISWQRYFEACRVYFKQHGDLLVPVNYQTDDGLKLGTWVANIRTYYRNGIQSKYITDNRAKQLEEIGMVWDVNDLLWQRNYSYATQYFLTHGNLDVPYYYVNKEGIKLGLWISSIRKAYRGTKEATKLTDEQIKMLNQIGMIWQTKHERLWENGFSHALEYYRAKGNLNVPTLYISPDGFKLGDWISNQRERYATGKMKQERIDRLDKLEMIWKKPDRWLECFKLAKSYYTQHGDLEIPPQYVADGIWVSKWLDEQRQIRNGKRKGKSLTDEQIKMLDSIGMRWCKRNEEQWLIQYRELKTYFDKYGNIEIPKSYKSPTGKHTGVWLQRQRRKLNAGQLNANQVQLLRAVGV